MPHVRLHTPAELAAAIPFLVGFHPTESLVAIGLSGSTPQVVLTMRIDLPPAAPRRTTGRAVRHLGRVAAGHLARAGATTAVVFVVTETPGPRPRQDVVTAMQDATADVGVRVVDALLVRAGRWWSYRCEAVACCPPEGTALQDADVGDLAAAAAYTGRAVHASREHLVASLAADPVDVDAPAVHERVRERLCSEAAGPGRAAVAAESRRLISEIVADRVDSRRPLSTEQVARLTLGLTDVLVRDWALTYVDSDLENAAESLWVELTRRALPGLVAAPATLVAVHAYLRGDGAYAFTALDRARDADPDYALAAMLAHALEHGTPPGLLRLAVEAARSPV